MSSVDDEEPDEQRKIRNVSLLNELERSLQLRKATACEQLYLAWTLSNELIVLQFCSFEKGTFGTLARKPVLLACQRLLFLFLLQLQTVQLRYKEEERTAESQFQEDCKLLMMERKIALEEKIRRMTEEKITAELAASWQINYQSKPHSFQPPSTYPFLFPPPSTDESWHLVGRKRRNLEFTEPEKKRKPATISDILLRYYPQNG